MPFLALFRVGKKQLDAASLTDTRSIIHWAVKLPLLQRQPRAQRASHRKCQRRMLAKNKKVTQQQQQTQVQLQQQLITASPRHKKVRSFFKYLLRNAKGQAH